MFLRWPFIHWRKLEIDKCRLFLTAEVALKGFNFIHLSPGSRPNDQTDRKWWITDLVFNCIPKSLTQQKVVERLVCSRWSEGVDQVNHLHLLGDRLQVQHRDPRTVAEKLTLSREKPWAGPGSYGGAAALIHSGPVRLVLTQFCPCYRGGTWRTWSTSFPTNLLLRLSGDSENETFTCVVLIIKIQEHFLICSCCVVA